MKVLACYSLKGGVGKTTAAVNLAYCASQQGIATLIWDLDPQGAASHCLSIKPRIKGGSKSLLKGKRPLPKVIRASHCPDLDLLPADFSNRNMDLFLARGGGKFKRLRELLRALKTRYGLVFLDCAPSISAVTESVFQAADALLVPLLSTRLSLRAYGQVDRFLERSIVEAPPVIPFFSIVDPRSNRQRRTVSDFARDHEELLRGYIPYAEQMELMQEKHGPIGLVAPGSAPARAYHNLWRQIEQRLARTHGGC
jgi:cellulose biosynthesis protein BcsQ